MLILRNDIKRGIEMKRSLIPMAVVLSIVSLFLNGPPAYAGDRGHGGGRRVSTGFSGGRHFGSMPARGGQIITHSKMGAWSGQRWGGRNWSSGTWSGQRWGGHNWSSGTWSGQRWGGHNWNGGNWGGGWHHHNGNDIVFIGDFGFPWWWGSYSWGWGYPYGYYDYSYPYDYYGYGYGYGDSGYGYGPPGYDYGNGYPYGGYYGGAGNGNGYPSGSSYYGSYYGGPGNGNGYSSGSSHYGSHSGGTGNGNDYPTHSRVAELQRRLARAGYYSGKIDGSLGPATREAIHAFERDHAKSIDDAAAE